MEAFVPAMKAISVAAGDNYDIVGAALFDDREDLIREVPSVRVREERGQEREFDDFRTFFTVSLNVYSGPTPSGVPSTEYLQRLQFDVEMAVHGMDWATLRANRRDVNVEIWHEEDDKEYEPGFTLHFKLFTKLRRDDLTQPIGEF